MAASLNDFSNSWFKRENVEPDALKEWKINIVKIIYTRISFYSRNTAFVHSLFVVAPLFVCLFVFLLFLGGGGSGEWGC